MERQDIVRGAQTLSHATVDGNAHANTRSVPPSTARPGAFAARCLAIGGLSLLLAGCPSPIFVKRLEMQSEDQIGAQGGQSLVTDAKVRVISHMVPGQASMPGQVDPLGIVCVEPHPDVAAALSSSAGSGLSVLLQGSATLSSTQVESLVQIAARTTAIQALLKQGYQLCLDYANGAVTGTTYSIRQSRLDDLLATLVLAETAAGAFGQGGAAIGNKGAAAGTAVTSGLRGSLGDLDSMRADFKAADEAVTEARAAVAAAEKTAEDAASSNADAAIQEKNKEELDARKKELEEAEEKRATLLASLEAAAEATSSASAETTHLTAMAGLSHDPSPEIAAVIGEMHERFIGNDPVDTFITTCLVEMGRSYEEASFPLKADELANGLDARTASNTTADRTIVVESNSRDGDDYPLRAKSFDSTGLRKLCEDNFQDVLTAHGTRRHELARREIELELARLNASSSASADLARTAELLGRGREDLGAIEKLLEQLEGRRTALGNTLDGQGTAEDRERLRKRADEIIARLDKAKGEAPALTAKGTELDADYLKHLADPARSAVGAERDVWLSGFQLLTAQLRLHANNAQSLRERLQRIKQDEERWRAEVAELSASPSS